MNPGDTGVEGYWLTKPSYEELYSFFKKMSPDEFIEDDDGSVCSYLYWDVIELKEIVKSD